MTPPPFIDLVVVAAACNEATAVEPMPQVYISRHVAKRPIADCHISRRHKFFLQIDLSPKSIEIPNWMRLEIGTYTHRRRSGALFIMTNVGLITWTHIWMVRTIDAYDVQSLQMASRCAAVSSRDKHQTMLFSLMWWCTPGGLL